MDESRRIKHTLDRKVARIIHLLDLQAIPFPTTVAPTSYQFNFPTVEKPQRTKIFHLKGTLVVSHDSKHAPNPNMRVIQ